MNYIDEELVNRNFDFKFSALAFNNVIIGIEAFQKHIANNREFFNYDKGKSLFSRLLAFSVERSFNNSAFTPTSSYSVNIGKLNDYGYNGLYIRTNDFLVTIAKTYKDLKLPKKADYKEKLSKRNSDIDTQMTIDTLNGRIISDEFKYATMTYGYKNDTLTHLNILVPSSNYKSTIYQKNLLKDVSIYKNIVPEDVKEEQITKLNQELQRSLRIR